MKRIASSNVVPNVDKTNTENFPLATPKCKLNKNSQTANKGRSMGLGVVWGPKTPQHKKIML